MQIFRDMTFKTMTQIILVFGVILALFLNEDFTTLSLVSTVALIAGFFNVYFTTNRSKHFLIPDMIWIVASIYVLIASGNYSDIYLYIFYIFVGIYQYINWSKHENSDSKVEVEYNVKLASIFLLIGLILTIVITFIVPQDSSNIILGAIISGFGISASVLLAIRNYFAQVIYVVVNFLQLVLYIIIGQGSLALIPLIFFVMSLIFVVQNRPTNKTKLA